MTTDGLNTTRIKQESLAIAKTTARCAQYMGALKVSRVLANAPGYFSRNL